MADSDKLSRFLRSGVRNAGRQYEEARRAFRAARDETAPDENGRSRIVCRRHAEQRTVSIDRTGRPDCFEAGHPDCEGCAEDIRAGCVETW